MNDNTYTPDDFHYALPDALIAQKPLAQRPASRMMHLGRASGVYQHGQFDQLNDFLHDGQLGADLASN